MLESMSIVLLGVYFSKKAKKTNALTKKKKISLSSSSLKLYKMFKNKKFQSFVYVRLNVRSHLR
jgi:hypothetical protein